MIRKHKFVHIKKMCLLMLLILATFIAVMPMANAAYNQSDVNVVRNINGLNLESDPFWWDTGIVTWSDGNPQRIIELNISGRGLVGNLNVTGLARLEYLDCSGNQLTSLNVTNNSNLLFLLCDNNQLTNLDVTKNEELRALLCSNNKLKSLNVENNEKIVILVCYENQLPSLNLAANTKLETLLCGNNSLTDLNVTELASLIELYCNNNQLQGINLSQNTKLTELICSDNQLTSLNLEKNTELTELYCNNNQLTALDVTKNTKLIGLICSDNQLTNLDVNTGLIGLICSDNRLTSLNLEKNTELKGLDCSNNQLASLDVTKNTKLENLYAEDQVVTLPSAVSNNGQLTIPNPIQYNGNLVTNIDGAKVNGNNIEWLGLAGTSGNVEFTFSQLPDPKIDGGGFTGKVIQSYVTETPTTTHTINFNSDGGTSISPQTVNSGGVAAQPSNPVKSGYAFVEWRLNGVAYNFSTPVTSNLTLVAVYTAVTPTTNYTVTFNSDGGTSIQSQTVNSGDLVAKPANPMKSGYTFVEWQVNGTAYNFSAPVTSNLTLVAAYKAVTPTTNYTVTFNTDGGTSIQSQTVNSGGLVAKPANPMKSGYNFVEWQVNGAAYNFSAPVNSNLTLVAVYKAFDLIVTFNSNGGTSVPAQNVKRGDYAVKPVDPVKKGYTFVEWRWITSGVAYNFNNPVTSGVALFAFYKANTTHTVTFNSDGGTSIPTKTVNIGSPVDKPANPTKSDSTFIEWRLNGVAYNFSDPVNSDLTLDAVYSNTNFTVTFNSNGGTSVPVKTVNIGNPVAKPADPTKSDYTFVEWRYTNGIYNFSAPVNSNLTLFAFYKANTTYTVTFNSDGGTSIPAQTVDKGSPSARPAIPAKSDYAFVEWQLNGVAYNFSAPVNSNLTLVAVYKPYTTYTVTFDTGHGMGYAPPQIVLSGKTATEPGIPFTNNRGTFVEWQLNGIEYNFSKPVTSNMTLVALYR